MLDYHFLVLWGLFLVISEGYFAELYLSLFDTWRDRIARLLDALVNFEQLEDQLNVGHGLPNEAPEGSQKVERRIHL